MIEKACDLWLEPAQYRCIPTSGGRNTDGSALLSSVVGKEAALRFEGIADDLGWLLGARGNHVHEIRPGILSFPVQQFAWAKPSVAVIQRSARELGQLVGEAITLLPRPGSELGGPPWDAVASVLSFLPDNIIIVEHGPKS